MPKLPKYDPESWVYMGVDPGENGSASVVLQDGTVGISFCDFAKNSEHDMADWFRGQVCIHHGHIRAALERVHSMPKQGVASSFSFGWNYGLVRGMLVAYSIPFMEPTPQAWQKRLGIAKRDTKNEPQPQFKKRLREFAQRKWPSVADKITLPLADSLLIAEWCRLEDRK